MNETTDPNDESELIPATDPTAATGSPFRDLPLPEPLQQALADAGFESMTPIQEQTIPPALEGRDILGKSQTGTGKTLAFGIPLLARADPARVAAQALILTPTRELADQVADHLRKVGEPLGFRIALVIGGEDMAEQILRRTRCQIIVGTPGRVLDLLKQRYLHVPWVESFVLDEFDRMLDIGFIDEVSAIAKKLPPERQTFLFSATMPPDLEKLAMKFVKDPVRVEIAPGLAAADSIEQRALWVRSSDRRKTLERILRDTDQTAIVFCNRIDEAVEVGRALSRAKIPCGVLQGKMDQDRRFAVMERFRQGRVRILVATDVAARGIDISHIGLIVNLAVPWSPEDYVHRIGRTGRMGRSGEVVTFVTERDGRTFAKLQRALGDRLKVEGEPLEFASGGRGGRGGDRPGGGGRRGGGSGGGGRSGGGKGGDGRGRSDGGGGRGRRRGGRGRAR